MKQAFRCLLVVLVLLATSAMASAQAPLEEMAQELRRLTNSGDYARAVELGERLLPLVEVRFGPEHPETAVALNNLASAYQRLGDYSRAEALFRRSLAICENNFGEDHVLTATALNNLATLYQDVGDDNQAETLLWRSLKIHYRLSGEQDPNTAVALNNLAEHYRRTGDFPAAEALYQESLKLREQIWGPDHPKTAVVVHNLAENHRLLGHYQEASRLYRRAIEVFERELGANHPNTLTSLSTLALLEDSAGDSEEAEKLHLRVLQGQEATLGLVHPNTTATLTNLALLNSARGRQQRALGFARQAAIGVKEKTENIFSFASERQRLAFLEGREPWYLMANIGSAPDILEALLRYKGLVLDSLIEDQRLVEASRQPELQELVEEVNNVRRHLVEAGSMEQKERRSLEEQLELAEGRLARAGSRLGQSRRALSLGLKDVYASLPEKAVLIEFCRYGHYLGKQNWEDRYGAVVAGGRGEPRWVPLGSAKAIERKVMRYQRGMHAEVPRLQPLQELYGLVWQPLRAALPPDTETVILCPDAELAFVSFASLVGPDDRFLGEEYRVTYVSSGRDLVARRAGASQAEAVLMGDPDYRQQQQDEIEHDSSLSRAGHGQDWGALSFDPLPFTRTECQDLAPLLEPARLYLGEQAREARLRELVNPRILHLATHGFFLGEAPGQDPMRRAGLAFSGAKASLDRRLAGGHPDPRTDGLLTAAEVGTLQLSGTELVVLSACDTGAGASVHGEGVFGLRRGFAMAGAQNLLMTLWPVADRETAEMMPDFYRRAQKLAPALALAEVQSEWLARLRQERGTAEAAQLAGPFVLSFQGRPWGQILVQKRP